MFDFSTFPVLTTERLILRDFRLSDAQDVLVFRGDPYVQRFNGPVCKTIEEAKSEIEEAHAEYKQQTGINWAVTTKENDKVLGAFAFHYWNKYHRRTEAGFDLSRAYWGQGIATESLQAILQFGFSQMNLNHIYAGTIADNHESVRLLERVGFHRDGTRRKFSWEDDGTFHDSAMYSMLKDEFKQL